MSAIVRGWSMGRAARPFFGVRWAELWSKPLADVRAELGVVIEPPATREVVGEPASRVAA